MESHKFHVPNHQPLSVSIPIYCRIFQNLGWHHQDLNDSTSDSANKYLHFLKWDVAPGSSFKNHVIILFLARLPNGSTTCFCLPLHAFLFSELLANHQTVNLCQLTQHQPMNLGLKHQISSISIQFNQVKSPMFAYFRLWFHWFSFGPTKKSTG